MSEIKQNYQSEEVRKQLLSYLSNILIVLIVWNVHGNQIQRREVFFLLWEPNKCIQSHQAVTPNHKYNVNLSHYLSKSAQETRPKKEVHASHQIIEWLQFVGRLKTGLCIIRHQWTSIWWFPFLNRMHAHNYVPTPCGGSSSPSLLHDHIHSYNIHM